MRHVYCPARAEVVEYACGIAPDLRGDYIEHVAGNMDTYSFRQPLGVRRHPPCIACCECFLGHLCKHYMVLADALLEDTYRLEAWESGKRIFAIACASGAAAGGAGVRGHLPVQLPGDDPAVDVPAGSHRRQHVRAQAVREGPGRGGDAGRARYAGRAAKVRRSPRTDRRACACTGGCVAGRSVRTDRL